MILHPAFLLTSLLYFNFVHIFPRGFGMYDHLYHQRFQDFMYTIYCLLAFQVSAEDCLIYPASLCVMTLPLDALKAFSTVWLKSLMGACFS